MDNDRPLRFLFAINSMYGDLIAENTEENITSSISIQVDSTSINHKEQIVFASLLMCGWFIYKHKAHIFNRK